MAPLPPELETQPCTREDICQVDDRFQAICISRDGRPAASIEWYIDNQRITDGLSMVEIAESLTSSNTTLYTSSQKITHTIRASDDTKQLICKTPHITDRGQPPQQVTTQLHVRCMYLN